MPQMANNVEGGLTLEGFKRFIVSEIEAQDMDED